MDPFQTFIHGDDLKKDLARLHDRYQGLPQSELDKGLIGFAASPPLDDSFLTASLWDKYLPSWREPRTKLEDLSPDLLDAIQQLGKEVIGAPKTKAHDEHDVDKLDFVTVSKKVSLKKAATFVFRGRARPRLSKMKTVKPQNAKPKVLHLMLAEQPSLRCQRGLPRHAATTH